MAKMTARRQSARANRKLREQRRIIRRQRALTQKLGALLDNAELTIKQLGVTRG